MSKVAKFSGFIVLILSIAILSFSLSYFALAWTEPTAAPPANNVSAPINVSATTQTKNGRLNVTALYDTNNSNYFIDPSNVALSGVFGGPVAFTDVANNSMSIWKDNRAGMEGITRLQSTAGAATADGNAYSILSIDAPYNKTVQEATLGLVTDDQIMDVYNMTYAGATRWGLAYINGTANPAKWRDFYISGQNGYGGPGTHYLTIKTKDPAAADNGFVGIGTTDPVDKLTISSDLSGADSSSIMINNSNPIDAKSRLRFTTDAGEFLISRTSSTYNIWPESAGDAVFNLLGPGGNTPTSNSIRFLIKDPGGASDQMIIKSNGNVGIGTTSPMTGRLVVSGGDIDVTGNKVINLSAPTASTDAATKGYVDAAAGGTGIIYLSCAWGTDVLAGANHGWDGSCAPPSCPAGWTSVATFSEPISVACSGAGGCSWPGTASTDHPVTVGRSVRVCTN